MECVHSGLDIFAHSGLQTSIQGGTYVEYRPLATLDDGPVEFFVKGNAQYLDLANSYLKVRAKVVQANGHDLAADAAVFPNNLMLHTLFSDVTVSLNGVQITTPSGAYPYQAYLQTLLSYGTETKKSQLEAAMWYADSGGDFELTDGADNPGVVARKARAARSRTIDMMGRLHSDLFHQGKYLLNHLDVRVKLSRSKDALVLQCARVGGQLPAYKAVIIDAGLHVRKVDVSPVIALAHARTLEKANAVYPLTRTVIRVFSAATGSLSFAEDNLFMDKLPNRIVLGFVKAEAYNGAYNLNPFNFQHCHVNYLGLYHQGKEIPGKALRPSFAADGVYTESYMSLFTGTNSAFSDTSCGVSLHEYRGGYTLFCFDLTPSLTHSHAAVEVTRPGPLRLEVQFEQALEQPTNLIVYAELDGHVELTRTREVLIL